MFDEKEMIGYDALDVSEEECDEEHWDKIKKMYLAVIDEVENSSDEMMKMTINAHKSMIEDRSDFDDCQKTVRRKRIIIMWHNTKVMNRKNKTN